MSPYYVTRKTTKDPYLGRALYSIWYRIPGLWAKLVSKGVAEFSTSVNEIVNSTKINLSILLVLLESNAHY